MSARSGVAALLVLVGTLVPLPAVALSGTATVARDVARVFNAPEGREIDRLRRGETVGLLRAVDRRSGSVGAVWVRVRRPGGAGYTGWMRARDLRPDNAAAADRSLPGHRQSSAFGGTGRAPRSQNGGVWVLDTPAAPAAAARRGSEIPIVDMEFSCRGGVGGHFSGCDLKTVFQLPRAAVARGALIARVTCEVGITWTDVSGIEHQQAARASKRLPVDAGTMQSSLMLAYDFREVATGALVDAQHCFAAGRR